MNQAGIALIWCVVQVTLIGLVTVMLYAAVRRVRPGAALPVVLAGLVAVVVLTTLAFSPWPRWSLPSGSGRGTAAVSNPLDTGLPTAATPDNASNPLAATGQLQSPIGASAGHVSNWEILLDELSRSQVPDASSGWNWPASVTAVFLCIGGLAMLWFAVGAIAVRGYRRRSRPIGDPALREQTDVLRAELECPCPVELRETDELVTAATIGWRRPVILLPVGWRDWTAPQRRAVLAHELAHIRAGDYLAMALGQFGLVLHFYHPLIHWLLARLRLEQELAADAAAAAVSGGQRAYLKTIAELALRQPHLPMAWPARSFLPTRTTFLRRVSMLRDSKLSVEKPSGPLRVLPIGMILAFGVLIAGLRGPVIDRPALAEPAEESAPAASKGAEQPSSEGGFDLSCVPKDAWLVWALRPAAVFGRPEFEELGDSFNQIGGPGVSFGVPLDELAQVTSLMFDPPDTSTEGQISVSNATAIILQAGKPHDFREFVTAGTGTSAHEHMGRTYHLQEGDSPHGYFRPDERTLVIGIESSLKTIIDDRSRGLPEYIDADTWREFRGDHMLVAANTTGSRSLMNAPRFKPGDGMSNPLAPLWESTSSIVVGIRLDDRLRLHSVVFSDDRQEANQVKQTLDALIVLIRNVYDKRRKPNATYFTEYFIITHVWHDFCALMVGFF